jgi:hypothetical protein
MQNDNVSSDRLTGIEQQLVALTVAVQTHQDLLREILLRSGDSDRAAIDKRYRELFAHKLEAHLLELEREDPGFAARVDYRGLLPP